MTTTLYSYWRSSCSWRVRIALALKNVDYKYVPVHLVKGEQRADDYVKSMNPQGQVPALSIDDHMLVESMAILEYLEETRAEPKLLPEDAVQRARCRAICQAIGSGIQPVQNLSVLQHVDKELSGDKAAWGKWAIERGFRGVEKMLSETAGKYAVGDQVTMADLFIVPQCYNARRFKVDLSQFPTIERIDKELSELEAFKKAAPDQQPDKQ